MVGVPWYLFSCGIALVIIGAFMTSFSRLGTGQPHIDPRMSNKKIARILKKKRGIPIGNFVILAGILFVLVSVSWRLLRAFLSYIPPGG
jgi:hypothetical protein